MWFELTQEDIDLNGHACNFCPYQRSISRGLVNVGMEKKVEVTSFNLELFNHKYERKYDRIKIRLPDSLILRIIRYDANPQQYPLTPHTFEIPSP